MYDRPRSLASVHVKDASGREVEPDPKLIPFQPPVLRLPIMALEVYEKRYTQWFDLREWGLYMTSPGTYSLVCGPSRFIIARSKTLWNTLPITIRFAVR